MITMMRGLYPPLWSLRAKKIAAARRGGFGAVDGGRGQRNIAHEVMVELGLEDVPWSVLPGPDRDAGRERFFMMNKAFHDAANSRCRIICSGCEMKRTALLLAVIEHGAAPIFKNPLDGIDGIGASRALFTFGCRRGRRASLSELEKVEELVQKWRNAYTTTSR